MPKRRDFTISEFYCTECGHRGIDIPRRICHQREAGHLKKLYCIYCKKQTNHCEIKPVGGYTKQDFLEEFRLGRFSDGNRIPVGELPSCSRTTCLYNKDGKCWNSNNSFECKHKIRKENQDE